MNRYKGSQSARAVEREYPHFMDITVPPSGLGSASTPCTTFTRAEAFGPSAATGGTTPTAASCDGALLIRLSLPRSQRSSKHLRVEHVASYSPIISAHHLVADVDP